MSLPIRVVYNFDRIKVCEECGKKIAGEVLKQVRSGNARIDLAKLLCDECWEYNVSNGGIEAEVDPRIVRR